MVTAGSIRAVMAAVLLLPPIGDREMAAAVELLAAGSKESTR